MAPTPRSALPTPMRAAGAGRRHVVQAQILQPAANLASAPTPLRVQRLDLVGHGFPAAARRTLGPTGPILQTAQTSGGVALPPLVAGLGADIEPAAQLPETNSRLLGQQDKLEAL